MRRNEAPPSFPLLSPGVSPSVIPPPPSTRPSLSSPLHLPLPPPPRRSFPSSISPAPPPPWLNAASSSSLFPPPPPRIPSGYDFIRRSEAAAAQKAEKAAQRSKARQRSTGSRSSYAKRQLEESPFLDKQLTAFVVRELEVKERQGKRELDGNRFVFLHSVADITGEVGHSSFCDLFVHAVRRAQEGALVPPEQRKYVGAGVDVGEKRKVKRRKVDRTRERTVDDSNEAIEPLMPNRRSPSPLQTRDTVEVEDDEDALIHPDTTAARKSPTLVRGETDVAGHREALVDPPNVRPQVDQALLRECDDSIARHFEVFSDGLAHERQARPMALPSALNSSLNQKRNSRTRPRHRREQQKTVVVDIIDVDEELRSSLPQPSSPFEVTDLVVVPRPPSPLLDLPLEPTAPPGVHAEEMNDNTVDPLMRRLSRFLLADGEVGDAFLLPTEVSLYTTAHPPLSLTPPISLTPPQPVIPTPHSVISVPSRPMPADLQVTPPRAKPPLSVPSAVPPSSPVSASVSISASSASPVQGSGGGPLTAAERKALAEAKRQQWLKAASIREEEKHPHPRPPPPPFLHSHFLPSASPSSVPTPHVALFSINPASEPSAVPSSAGMRKEKEKENGWGVGTGSAQKQHPQPSFWR